MPSGYDPNERFFATRYRQGGRTVFSLDLSVRELVAFLPKPDPDRPLDASSTQRRIVPAHAKQFGQYIVENPDWVSPALLLRAPHIFAFEDMPEIATGSTQFGVLAVPKDAKSEISIVDGQHRTLGFHLAWEMMTAHLTEARALVDRAKSAGEPAVIREAENHRDEKVARRDQLAAERVSVQIVLVENPDVARRIFVDINDNAKGITGAVKSRFDDRKVVTRAVNAVLPANELLEGRVDLEADRVSGNSKYLLGAKHVAEIVKGIAVGTGTISKRLEQELDHKALAADFTAFTDALTEAFVPIQNVVNGTWTPAQAREKSLIGSNVVLRAMAVAWHDLRKQGLTPGEITIAFSDASEHFRAPVYPDGRDSWFSLGVFPIRETGAVAPTSRIQDFKTLSGFIVRQCRETTREPWFRAASADQLLLATLGE